MVENLTSGTSKMGVNLPFLVGVQSLEHFQNESFGDFGVLFGSWGKVKSKNLLYHSFH
jgi:hypothetical protein